MRYAWVWLPLLLVASASAVARDKGPDGPSPPFPPSMHSFCPELIRDSERYGVISLRHAGKRGGNVMTMETWNNVPWQHRYLLAHCAAYVLTGSSDAPPAGLRIIDERSGKVQAVLDEQGFRDIDP